MRIASSPNAPTPPRSSSTHPVTVRIASLKALPTTGTKLETTNLAARPASVSEPALTKLRIARRLEKSVMEKPRIHFTAFVKKRSRPPKLTSGEMAETTAIASSACSIGTRICAQSTCTASPVTVKIPCIDAADAGFPIAAKIPAMTGTEAVEKTQAL